MTLADGINRPTPDRAVPVVLIHGNPETPSVWAPVVDLLERSEVHTPNLPGFGCPVPPDFSATKEDYADWLIAEIAAIGRPVHLVGHDWGGVLVVRVAQTRPDLLVSWCSDAVELFNPSYTWHDLAQVWQTPSDGEANIELMVTLDPELAIAGFESIGIPTPQATAFIDAFDATMGACVLSLYRSAVPELLAPWRAASADAAQRPGLAILATADTYMGSVESGAKTAAVMGAETVTLDDLGHWWMLQDPELAALVLSAWFARHEE
ncbi:MAG: alpha/beta hydrolase [Acidimicrobiales bacterium]